MQLWIMNHQKSKYFIGPDSILKCNIWSPTHHTRRIIQDQHAFIPRSQTLPFCTKKQASQRCAPGMFWPRSCEPPAAAVCFLFQFWKCSGLTALKVLGSFYFSSSHSQCFQMKMLQVLEHCCTRQGHFSSATKSKSRWGRTVLAEELILAVNNQPVTSDLALVT